MTLEEFISSKRFDGTERNLWRALDLYEQDLCPGCGQPHTVSLYDKDKEQHPTYGAGFVECLGCKELLDQQEAQRLKDAAKQHSLNKQHEKQPHKTPQLVTGHRHWRAWQQTPASETSSS